MALLTKWQVKVFFYCIC